MKNFQRHHRRFIPVMFYFKKSVIFIASSCFVFNGCLKTVRQNAENHLCVSCRSVMYKFKPPKFRRNLSWTKRPRGKPFHARPLSRRNRKAGNLPRFLCQNTRANELCDTRVPWYAELKMTALHEAEIFAVNMMLTSMISRLLHSHAE